MRSAAILLLLFLSACDTREPVVPDTANADAPAEVTNPAVSLSPPSAATEVAPGVFILRLSARSVPGSRIEEMPEVLLVETLYDEEGKEAATSVPSFNWSLLTLESKVRLAGMREGERRRIWTCSDSSKATCQVADVMIGDRAKAIAARGAT